MKLPIAILVILLWCGFAGAQTVEQLQHDNDLLRKDVEIANLKRADAEKDLAQARADANHYRGLFLGEQARQMMTGKAQLVPHSNTSTFDKVLKVFDSQLVMTGFRIGIPLIQTYRSFAITPVCPIR